jgi:hypothetical protein
MPLYGGIDLRKQSCDRVLNRQDEVIDRKRLSTICHDPEP